MKGKNTIRKSASLRMRIVIGAQVFWIGVVCLVGAWWGVLLLRQAAKIAELEVASGMARSEAHVSWLRTQRMLYWESTAFFLLAVLSSAFLFWLYWLDMRRTRGVQAFFASVTHELRTPLTSIRLQAESIADNLGGPAQGPHSPVPVPVDEGAQRKLIARLLEDTGRLESQVERTLELARVEGGGPVFVQPVRLKPWLSRLAQNWRDSYGAKAVISLDIPEIVAEADPTALQIVLKNLIENSLKHSRKEPVRIRIEGKGGGRFAEISLCDDGAGFAGDPKELGKLFHRGESSQGSGVGLYLVRALMKRMGGEVRFAQANPGTGFSTHLELPQVIEGGDRG